MIGLIKKDLLIAKGNLKTLIILFIVFTLMTINGYYNFSFIPSFLSMVIMMSTFSYDQYNNTNAYITAFPNGKQNAVKSKYISTIIILIITTLLTVLITSITVYINNNININEIISLSIGTLTGVIILESILYPIIFKFGMEKSRIGIFLGVFLISGLIAFLSKKGFKITIPKNILSLLNNYYMIIIPIFVIAILFTSYIISKKIFIKKEF